MQTHQTYGARCDLSTPYPTPRKTRKTTGRSITECAKLRALRGLWTVEGSTRSLRSCCPCRAQHAPRPHVNVAAAHRSRPKKRGVPRCWCASSARLAHPSFEREPIEQAVTLAPERSRSTDARAEARRYSRPTVV